MVVKSRNAFGTLGTWTDYERGWGDPTWKDKNWGGWDATDADFFGDARKWFEGHDHYSQFVGDYGSKNLFDSFGGEYSFYNPGKTVGSHSKWTGGKSDLFKLAKDLYYYESKNPLAPEPEPPPPPPPAPPQQATWDEEVDLSPKPIDVSDSPEAVKGLLPGFSLFCEHYCLHNSLAHTFVQEYHAILIMLHLCKSELLHQRRKG